MTEAAAAQQPQSGRRPGDVLRGVPRRLGAGLRTAEVDTRLFGMVIALAVIWVGFNVVSDGSFLTARNLWNLSVQSASIGIMATGMVLVIVSRNIDLSVGSLLGFLAYTMAMVQIEFIPKTLGLGLDQPYTWIVALAIGLAFGVVLGAVQGSIIGYGGVPSFIVTLGGLLVFRGLIWSYPPQGQTLAPMDAIFQLLGGGPDGSLGGRSAGSWASSAASPSSFSAFRSRPPEAPAVRLPAPADVGRDRSRRLRLRAVLGAVWVANAYSWPRPWPTSTPRTRHAIPPGGLIIPIGIANPVLILIGVTIVMTYIATRRRFGRNVYAIRGQSRSRASWAASTPAGRS